MSGQLERLHGGMLGKSWKPLWCVYTIDGYLHGFEKDSQIMSVYVPENKL